MTTKHKEVEIPLWPFKESIGAEKRMEIVTGMSELVTRMAMHVICHTMVDYADLLDDERRSIAHGFLQRMTTTHICNHKLTTEGLVYEYEGREFGLHEEYKTMTLTRTVYEHLAMFYFLYELPKTEEERDVVWKYWKINSMKSEIGNGVRRREAYLQEMEKLRDEILVTILGKLCFGKLSEWTDLNSAPQNGSIEFIKKNGKYDVRRVPFSQAWRYLFRSDDMRQLYGQLSMHCHPVYGGLVEYQSQSASDDGGDGIPLYLSCRFLAYLCRLFLKQLPDGDEMTKKGFSTQERKLFYSIGGN